VVNPAASAAPISRRAVLWTSGGGLLAGLAVVSSGCGGHARARPRHQPTAAQRAANVEVLNGLLDVEHRAIAAYTAGTPLLGGQAQKAAQQFLGQEFAHVSELQGLIMHQKGTPNKALSQYDFGRPTTHHDVLQLLHDVERAQITAYLAAIPEVTQGSVRSALGAILGSDAQHIAVLRANLGRPALADALVTGNE
jgi:bacterioferritin (cytochrome b1)